MINKNIKKKPKKNQKLPEIFIFTDDYRLSDPVTLAKLIPKDWGIVIRNYQNQNRIQLIKDTAKICKKRRIFFMVSGDWRLAVKIRANGIHMPIKLLKKETISTVIKICDNLILSIPAHNSTELRFARLIGADAFFLSPIKTSTSHPQVKPIGILPFSSLARNQDRNIYALGGINLRDKKRLQNLGAKGIAGISIGLAYNSKTKTDT